MIKRTATIHLFYCANSVTEAELQELQTRLDTDGLKTLSLPCSGKATIPYLLKAFEKGADGVVLCTCPESQCKHLEGNLRASKRAEAVDGLLDEIGFGKGRVVVVTKEQGQSEKLIDDDPAAPNGAGRGALGRGPSRPGLFWQVCERASAGRMRHETEQQIGQCHPIDRICRDRGSPAAAGGRRGRDQGGGGRDGQQSRRRQRGRQSQRHRHVESRRFLGASGARTGADLSGSHPRPQPHRDPVGPAGRRRAGHQERRVHLGPSPDPHRVLRLGQCV